MKPNQAIIWASFLRNTKFLLVFASKRSVSVKLDVNLFKIGGEI